MWKWGIAVIDPNKNCHEYCRFRKICTNCKGSNGSDGKDPREECGLYDHFEDLEMEARDIANEERRAMYEVGEEF